METTQTSISKKADLKTDGTELPLVESFFSVQGEGHHTGTPVYFIRLGGCDVGCPWCDTKESWDAEFHSVYKLQDLLDEVKKEQVRTVVLTGGEPTVHPLTPITDTLRKSGIAVHLETSGAHPLSGLFDWVCLSPKRFSPPMQDYYALADELKVVVHNERDIRWAEEEAAKVRADCKLFLQPQWERVERSNELILSYIREHPKWRISVQTHKYLRLP